MTNKITYAEQEHILELPENSLGEDIIIGDVHGNCKAVEATLATMGASDRLFIVGDLVDRGEDSLGMVRLVHRHRPDGGIKPSIYVTQGNHECNIFMYCAIKLAPEGHPLRAKLDKEIEWLEHPQVGGSWMLKLTDDELMEVYNITRTFPFIIRVNDKAPFNIVHSRMPFNDDVLLKKCRSANPAERQLASHEANYAIEARKDGSYPLVANRDSGQTLVYCGHDVIVFSTDKCIMETENTVNLDAGMHFTNAVIAVHHKARQAVLIGKPSPIYASSIEDLLHSINVYLAKPSVNFKKYASSQFFKPPIIKIEPPAGSLDPSVTSRI